MASVRESRFDLRSTNRAFAQDVLDFRELRLTRNMRAYYGLIEVRPGTQRIHVDTIASAGTVLGLHQWNGPSVSGQVVAIAGGHLYHKLDSAANFTEVTSTLSTTNRPWFAAMKKSGTLTQYIAEGAFRKWSGSALTLSISGAPAARSLAVYKERMCATDGTDTIYLSKVGDAETWASPDGVSSPVATYDDEALIGLATVGSSLLMFKNSSISRYTGKSQDDIQIDKETEGVSPEVGCIAAKTIVRFGGRVFFLSDRGPYMCDESGASYIGQKIETEFITWNPEHLANSVAVVNRRRREILLMVPESGETQNNVGWLWNYESGAWSGPQEYSEEWAAAALFERADGTRSIMYGGYDGRVREADVTDLGANDDLLRDDSGGTAIDWRVEFPSLMFRDPGALKQMEQQTQYLRADLGAATSTITAEFDSDTMGAARTQTITTKGAGFQSYDMRIGWDGKALELAFERGTGTRFVQIASIALEAELGRKVA